MRKTRLTLLLGLVISSNGNATVNEPLVNSNNVNLFEFGTVDTAWNSSRNDKTLFVLMAQELQKNRLFVVRL
ncbi:hypothetical protein [Vibrio owensii]|uniref:hypothetical protein n=1 Tax=Vibrio owensii TaxID=696485 RepID=UPI00406984BC